MLRSIDKQSGESVESVLKRSRVRVTIGGHFVGLTSIEDSLCSRSLIAWMNYVCNNRQIMFNLAEML